MPCIDGWKDDEHAAFLDSLRILWSLEKSLPVEIRSSAQQIFSQISDKLNSLGFKRGPLTIHGHWFHVVRVDPEFRDTFKFHEPPPPNGARNSSASASISHKSPTKRSDTITIALNLNPRSNLYNPRSSHAREAFKSEIEKNIEDTQAGSEQAWKATVPTRGSDQRQSAISIPSNSHPISSKKTNSKWSTKEDQKLEELVNAAIQADRGKPEGSRLKGIKFFDKVSERLKELGIDRHGKSCSDRWQRMYPGGNDVERGFSSNEDELMEPKPKISKVTKPLEASDLAPVWSDEEKQNLAKHVAESFLDREDDAGVLVRRIVQWNLVQSKHKAMGYTRTMASLRVQWYKQSSKTTALVSPQPVKAPQSDSEDDLPLSEVRASRLKKVNTTGIKPLSFEPRSSASEPPARTKVTTNENPNASKKRSHAATFTTSLDKESAAQHIQQEKRARQETHERVATGMTPMELKIKEFDCGIADLEKEIASAPREIQSYETELLQIEVQMEKLRIKKECTQAAKMELLEKMSTGAAKIELMRKNKAQLMAAMAIMGAL